MAMAVALLLSAHALSPSHLDDGNLTCSVGGSNMDDMFHANMTPSAAAAWCRNNSRCAGFAAPAKYPGACDATGVLSCHFKDSWAAKRRGKDPSWSYWTVPGPRPPPPPRPYDTPPNPCGPNVTDQPKYHIMNMGVGPHDLNSILHWKGVWHIMHQANWTDWAHVSLLERMHAWHIRVARWANLKTTFFFVFASAARVDRLGALVAQAISTISKR